MGKSEAACNSGAELSKHSENLPVQNPNRIIIYGSALAGVYEMSEQMLAYLQERGIPNPQVNPIRDAGYIYRAFYHESIEESEGDKVPTLPRGVILLPEMRQYTPQGMGMTLDTYSSGISEFIENLCSENGVPLVMFTGQYSPQLLDQGLKSIADNPPQLPGNSDQLV